MREKKAKVESHNKNTKRMAKRKDNKCNMCVVQNYMQKMYHTWA